MTVSLAVDLAGQKLPPGVYVQIYRAKVPGATHAARLAVLDDRLAQFASLGAKGIVWHGFSTEMDVDALRDLTALCRDHDLLSLAAFGMDATDPAGKGERIGRVLESDVCDGVVLDAEGAWEGASDDRERAKAFAAAFLPHRALVPHKPVIDQPWPLPSVHQDWPWEEFAACVDARAPQWYVNDWQSVYGASRYAKCMGRFDAAWSALRVRLSRTQSDRPVWDTIQGYGWADIPHDLMTALSRSSTTPVLVWCEPFPDAAFMAVWYAWAGQYAPTSAA